MAEQERATEGPEGGVSTSTGIAVAAAFLVASVALFGYAASLLYESLQPDLSPRAFAVDAPGVRYLWYDMRRGLLPAARLEEVPGESRSAVVVLGPGWPQGADRRDDGWYVSDLRGVSPGEEAWARWSGRAEIASHAHAVAQAKARVLEVRVRTTELANISPGSQRRESSVRAIREFEKKVAPVIRETHGGWGR